MNDNLIDLATKLKKFNKNFDANKHRIVALNNIFNSKFLYLEHFLSNEVFIDSPYRNILINYFKNAENQFPGSSRDVSVLLTEKLLGYYKETKKEKTDNKIDNIFSYLSKQTDDETFKIFKEIIEFSGPDATIVCNETKDKEFTVEKNCMPTFKVNIQNEFMPVYFSNTKEYTKDVIISVIDGYIERESELIPLIEKSREEELPVVLLCRGLSYEATNQLKAILIRNKIKLYPYVAKFNDKDPFLFDDIAKIAKTEKVSSETMDSIYTDTVEKCSIIKVKISANQIKFFEENKELKDEVIKQIQAAKDSNSNALDYLTKRKSRISPNNIHVNIPNKKIKMILEIKNLIKTYNRLAAHGVFIESDLKINSNFKHQLVNRLSESLYNNIKNIGYTIKLGEKNANKEV